MQKNNAKILVGLSVAVASSVVAAQTLSATNELVTVEDYNRAQSDVNFARAIKGGGVDKFTHGRELASPEQRDAIIRPNRDTLYSFAVFDLDAGPVTVTLPDVGKRFMNMQIVNQEQYTPAV
jgi:hypothetical protein